MSSGTQGIAERIRQLREAAGLNKTELARRVGVSDVTVIYWERGNIKQIGHERLLSLASALEITVSELLDDPLLEMRDARISSDSCLHCAAQSRPSDSHE